MNDWAAHVAREAGRYRDGVERLPSDPDARQRQLVRVANAACGAGLASLMAGASADAHEWFVRAAERYRESYEHAPPASYGRPIGAIKMRLLAGDMVGARDDARWALAEQTADAESPIGRYAACLAALVLGDDIEARRLASGLQAEDTFPASVTAALAGLATGDGELYRQGVEATLASFEQRDEYLEDVPVADTVLVLEELARPRGLAAGPRSTVLPEIGKDWGMPDYYDLGTYSRPVSTPSPEAQVWFDRGLLWCYAYNHDESVRCFERAAELDGSCAMAYWGIAYATGPNYNKAWEAFDEVELPQAVHDANAAARQALALAGDATPVERALIEALQHRYPSDVPAEDCAIWNDRYAAAMRDVYAEFPDDRDVATLFAEALMNRTPWQLWDLATGEPAEGADTTEAIDVLERALAAVGDAGDEPHAGLLHMYIHLMEMSPHPERALRACDELRNLVPDAGHLQHMPTHIDVLCGNYRDVVTGNERAIVADRKFLEREGPLNFYSLYRCHDYHFKLYGAMFLGQLEPALEAADEMVATLPDELLRVEVPPMADWLESFVSMKMHALIRFGRWQEIVDEPLPENEELFCVTTAVKHYAKGVAHAALGAIEAAEEHRARFVEAVERVPPTRYVFNNTCLDILAIAAEMLNGEVEYRKGNVEVAFEHLRRSVELDDSLPYDEPWGWMQPTRHALGALLLEQGRVEEAEAVYRADLGLDGALSRACQHPDNVWSLHGLHECLRRLGKTGEAALLRQRLDLAAARADVPIRSSCFCRQAALEAA